MKSGMIGSVLLSFFIAATATAFDTKDEQIDFVLNQLATASQDKKEQVLERLQWSGLSDPRLFDVFEQDSLAYYQENYLPSDKASVLAYEVRALGYSGNVKYEPTLTLLSKKAKNSSLKRHAKKALRDLDVFAQVQTLLQQQPAMAGELSYEKMTYMQMLKTDDSFTQRLAARAIYHEKQTDKALLDLAAVKLRALYKQPDLDEQTQDTAAWMAKVLKQHTAYNDLLGTVADDSPYRKIRRYAK